jgi:hypothetical protein
VSVEAISWALNLAPVSADRGGQPSTACKFVLVGLANHARPDGTGAFPSVATLVRYTGQVHRSQELGEVASLVVLDADLEVVQEAAVVLGDAEQVYPGAVGAAGPR